MRFKNHLLVVFYRSLFFCVWRLCVNRSFCSNRIIFAYGDFRVFCFTVNIHRWSSLSSRRCAYLEQATWQRHVRYIAVNLPDTTETHSVPAIIPRHYSVTLTVIPIVVLAVACHLGHSKNTDWLIDWLVIYCHLSSISHCFLDISSRSQKLCCLLWRIKIHIKTTPL